MARQLTRSISTIQPDMADKNIALRRNISYNGTSSFGSQILTTGNIAGDTSQIKDCLLDGQAQVGEFIKEYELDWNMWDANIVLRYCDAEIRLPKISANLSKCKLQSLSLVKNMLKSMDDNLMTSLKPSSQKEQLLPSLLMGAEHAIANTMLLCMNSDPDFRFEKFEHKEISLSNDIMSAAMLIHRYLTDVTNNIGK